MSNIKKNNFTYFIATTLILIIIQISNSYANYNNTPAPVVIEYFGKNSCNPDTSLQDHIRKIVMLDKNIHVINCRTENKRNKERKDFTLQYCTDRKNLYEKKFNAGALTIPSFIIINGRWDANRESLLPAIKLARSDNIKTISINVNDNSINISIPKINNKHKFGEIILYAYAPTIDEKAIFVDADLQLTDKLKERINKNQSVPFVTKARTIPFYFRPVVTIEKISKWINVGENEFNIAYPLSKITMLSGIDTNDLSYIAVLYKNNEVGNILAAGEYISAKELNNTLPRSEPMKIKLITPDPKDVIPE